MNNSRYYKKRRLESYEIGSEYAKPRNVGDRDHYYEKHDEDLEPALLADTEVRRVLVMGVCGFADAAGLCGSVLGRMVVVFECRVMGHIHYSLRP
jgi:hypothetical protein